jgi:hypothetical protein
MGRGDVNDLSKDTQLTAKGLLGRELTVRDVRLYPYIDYCSKNNEFHRERINEEERTLLQELRDKKLIEYSSSPTLSYVKMSPTFYRFICNVLWETYVDHVQTGLTIRGEE